MFAALTQLPGCLPQFETKKALLILNCQNDTFYQQGDFFVTRNPEFLQPLREMIPYFRKMGEIIWVRLEMGVVPSAPSPDAEKVERESANLAEQNRKMRGREEAHLKDDTNEQTRRAQLPLIDPAGTGELPTYDPSSRTKQLMTRASADARSEKRSANLQIFDSTDGSFEERLLKPRKGQQSRFFIAGTKGAEICDDLVTLVDEQRDMILTKHFYSAFDQTSLLESLRMQLITEVYLCGAVTNASIYSTAADAVQHGLGVYVVEDCLGYRSFDKHQEALRQMSDIMGVNSVFTEDIIEESGGRDIPSAETPGITLPELHLTSEERKAQASVQGKNAVHPQRKELDSEGKRPTRAATDAKVPATEDVILAPAKSASKSDSKSVSRSPALRAKARSSVLGPDDVIGSGDSRIVFEFLGDDMADQAFSQLKDEVNWQTMGHRGGQVPRLVAVQGEIGKEGEVPLYRHPADESPPLLSFTPTVWKIKEEVERLLGQPFNHALIHLYRSGEDNISEHADKTLDIVRGSSIVNVSLGAQRVMTLRMKKSMTTSGTDNANIRKTQRVPMPHDSIFIFGSQSNREWLHGVRADKRPSHEKTEKEKAFGGERISITFREIGTFINEGDQTIWGSGARNKRKSQAGRISKDDSTQMDAMVIAFGKENHEADFDWELEYGTGFDVVDLTVKREKAKLVLSSDPVANLRVQLSLEEKGIPYTLVQRDVDQQASGSTLGKPWIHGLANTESPILSGLAPDGTAIGGDLAILIHLEKYQEPPVDEVHEYTTTQLYSCAAQSNELLYLWHELKQSTNDGRTSSPTARYSIENKRVPSPEISLREELHTTLKGWEEYIAEAKLPFIAGHFWSVIDCIFWPVLNNIAAQAALKPEVYPNLLAYHRRAMERTSVRRVAGPGS
ncbi:MAG: hypothetical protein Q9163_000281 [Psora crenata]